MLTQAATAQLTLAGLNLIGQALSIYDAELKLVVCNRRFQQMFALPERLVTPGAAFDHTIRFLAERGEYGDVDNVENWVQSRVDLARNFEPHYIERTRSNGQVVSIEGSPLAQGGWVTVYTDITDIKHQEHLLRARSETLSGQLLDHAERQARTNRALAATNAALVQTQRDLTEIEARTRMTAEMMPAHIAHVDLSGHYTYSNRRLGAIIPGRPKNILGLHMAEALGADAWAKIEPHSKRAYGGEASVFEFNEESAGRRIRVALTPDRHNGEIRGIYILSMDITEEAQARSALGQTRKRELAAQMTSGMAHDFANLLTIILGMQSRLDRMDMPPEARELIKGTLSAARRGGTLLDRIAQMSAPRDTQPEATDLRQFLNDLRTLAAPSLPSEVDFSITVDGLEAPVMLDGGALRDSLLNLLLNAKDAIGAVPGQISLSARAKRDTWLDLTVSDSGPGFSDQALAHALDPFFTTKGGEGSGLGLAMVYDQTKLSGGRVLLGNHHNGARVTLRLPLRLAATPTKPTLVLLVEDSPDIRQSVREMLTGLGHSVIEAASAEEGEELAQLPGIGLILSDISLPNGRTGLDMLTRLRHKGVLAPARLMTSLPPGDGLRQTAAARFPLIGKPFSEAELATFLVTDPTP